LEFAESQPSLFDLTADWLERMPFDKFQTFDFWKLYGQAVDNMLESDAAIVKSNPSISDERRAEQLKTQRATRDQFNAILDSNRYGQLQGEGSFRLPHRAFLAALFIHLYREEPVLYAPFRYLVKLVEIDEAMTRWRTRHVMMVHRMLGAKIGTGGSSGHDYLSQTASRNRIWTDLFNISTFLIPRSKLPRLPQELSRALGFHFSEA
jgi:tryptophan 2,3-dioxygenase